MSDNYIPTAADKRRHWKGVYESKEEQRSEEIKQMMLAELRKAEAHRLARKLGADGLNLSNPTEQDTISGIEANPNTDPKKKKAIRLGTDFETFKRKKQEILFNTSLSDSEKEYEIQKLINEIYPNQKEQSISTKDTPMRKKAEDDVNAYLDSIIKEEYYNTYMDDLNRQEQDIKNGQVKKEVDAELLNAAVNAISAFGQNPVKGNMPDWAYYSKFAADFLGNTYSSPSLINTPVQPDAEYYRKLDTVQAKKDYLKSTPYRYIVINRGEVYPFSSRDEYINNLDNYINALQSGKRNLSIPGASKEEQEEYRNWYIGYLKDILYMNKQPGDYWQTVQQNYDNIDKSSTK